MDRRIYMIKQQLYGFKQEECLAEFDTKTQLIQQLPTHLNELKKWTNIATQNANLRNTYLKEGGEKMQSLAVRLRQMNTNSPELFQRMHNTLVIELIHDALAKRSALKERNILLQKNYALLEWLVSFGFGALFIIVLILTFGHLIRLYRNLETQLKIDSLTQLPNRFALTTQIINCPNPTIGILNINGFRTINEVYGIGAGNESLVSLANFLQRFAKEYGYKLYRIGGDEFVFFTCKKDLHVKKFAKTVTEICKKISSSTFFIKSNQKQVKLSVSGGICSNLQNPLEKASIALYRAKKEQSQVKIYDETMDEKKLLEENRFWIGKIHLGIEQKSFMPFFQPIVNVQGSVAYYEALMRLKLFSDQGVIQYFSPAQFLSLSKRIKQYPIISSMTIFKSLEAIEKYNIPISINISYLDVLNFDLKSSLLEKISKTGLGGLLTFEIIETEDIKNYDLISDFVKDFRELGVKLALDDFGSGFSNFHYISSLKPEIIKIDGSLIKDLDTNLNSIAVVKSICTLCKRLKIHTVAEFVHNESVFLKARELGVDYFQGYYFSPPVLEPKKLSFLPKASSKESKS